MSRGDLVRALKISAEDRAHLDAALAEGHGVVIVSAHLGAFDFVGQGLHLLGYPLTCVTARTTARFVFDGVTFLRGSQGPAMVDATPVGIRRTIQVIRHGGCAVILVDRDFFMNGMRVVFFGRETTLPIGALRIARETGAPVVPVFPQRVPGGHVLRIDEPFRIERTADLDADLADGLQRLVPVLERAIGRAPGQWVMFQRVWPEEPADPVRAFPVGSPFAVAAAPRRAAGLRRWIDRVVRGARRDG
jgi:KDO2-lipid IV(A) lauroyltransferase